MLITLPFYAVSVASGDIFSKEHVAIQERYDMGYSWRGISKMTIFYGYDFKMDIPGGRVRKLQLLSRF